VDGGDGMKSFHNHIPNTSKEIDVMDIRMTKHMKALLFKIMTSPKSHELVAEVLSHWFDEIYHDYENDWINMSDVVKDWPKYKVVKDTIRFYFHVGKSDGLQYVVVEDFIKVLNKQMEWTGVSLKPNEVIE
jgi:hypothetical protein